MKHGVSMHAGAPIAKDARDADRAAVPSSPAIDNERMLLALGNHTPQQRLAMATDPTTATSLLIALADDSAFKVRAAVAAHPNTPPEVLRVLAFDTATAPARAVATNPNTSRQTVLDLATWCSKPAVLVDLVGRDDLDDETFAVLAQSIEGEPRIALAQRDPLPLATLNRLAYDTHPQVRAALAQRSDAPPHVLTFLAATAADPTHDGYIEGEYRVIKTVVANPATPVEVLDLLAYAPSRATRAIVSDSPRLSKQAREHVLADDLVRSLGSALYY